MTKVYIKVKIKFYIIFLLIGGNISAQALSPAPRELCKFDEGYQLPKEIEFVDDYCYSKDIQPLIVVKKDNKQGLIDRQGNIEIPLEYESIEQFHGKRALVGQNGKFGYIDEQNNIVIPILYDGFKNLFDHEIFSVKNNNKYGFISDKGVLITDIIYDDVGYFSEGLGPVGLEDKYGFVSEKENWLFPLNMMR